MLEAEKNYELYHGDCLAVMDEMISSNVSVDMVLCDLPYGTTRNKWDSVIDLEAMWDRLEALTKENTCIALFAQTPFDKVLGVSNIKMLRYEWIWEKSLSTGFLNAKKMPLKTHENILIFYKKLPVYNPQMRTGFKPYKSIQGEKTSSNYGKYREGFVSQSSGERFPIDVLQFSSDRGLHPTQKPVKLLEYLIKTYSNVGDTILDHTCGSGSTGVAALNTDRKFIGIEKDDKYFEIARNRLEETEALKNQSSLDLFTVLTD